MVQLRGILQLTETHECFLHYTLVEKKHPPHAQSTSGHGLTGCKTKHFLPIFCVLSGLAKKTRRIEAKACEGGSNEVEPSALMH